MYSFEMVFGETRASAWHRQGMREKLTVVLGAVLGTVERATPPSGFYLVLHINSCEWWLCAEGEGGSAVIVY